jgi:hypothetical protein
MGTDFLLAGNSLTFMVGRHHHKSTQVKEDISQPVPSIHELDRSHFLYPVGGLPT